MFLQTLTMDTNNMTDAIWNVEHYLQKHIMVVIRDGDGNPVLHLQQTKFEITFINFHQRNYIKTTNSQVKLNAMRSSSYLRLASEAFRRTLYTATHPW